MRTDDKPANLSIQTPSLFDQSDARMGPLGQSWLQRPFHHRRASRLTVMELAGKKPSGAGAAAGLPTAAAGPPAANRQIFLQASFGF
jgi:hypothetical protein